MRLLWALCASALAATSALADPVADFYRGKSIRLIVGAAAGGGYDIPARLLANHMGKHVPGNPSFVVENMPGAASLIMTNYLYARAPRDGTAMGMPNNNIPLEPRLKQLSREGGNVSFDVTKFNWLGSPVQEPQVLVTLSSAAKTFDDLKSRKVIVGSTGTTADNYSVPALLNQIFGTKMEIVTGYKGQSDIFLAMEQGEVQGNSTGLTNVLVTKADWLRSGKVSIVMQIGLERSPELPQIVTPLELAPNQETRDLLRLFLVKYRMARPIALPPDVPADRLKALNAAFDATMKDPAFLAEAKQIGLDINPVGGAEMTRLVSEIQAAPQATVDRLQKLLAPPAK